MPAPRLRHAPSTPNASIAGRSKRSEIARANYNLLACHALRLPGALTAPVVAHVDRGGSTLPHAGRVRIAQPSLTTLGVEGGEERRDAATPALLSRRGSGPAAAMGCGPRWRRVTGYRRAVPRISAFYGVVIYMYWNERDHPVAHFRRTAACSSAS